MAATALVLLALSSTVSFTAAVLFNEPRIFGEDATGYGPIFEEEPMDVVYTEDSPDGRISMNCRARANPPASYRWRRDNWEIKLMEQPDEYYSLVGGNLVINNPKKKKHAGTYICVARNIYGTVISKEARVKFGYLEEFPQDERDSVYAVEGQGAVLLCVPPKAWPAEVSYRWIYNEFPIFLHTDRRRFVSQKTGNLYIAKVEAQDAGNYSCFVSSPVIGKSVFSKFTQLIPTPPKEPAEEKKYRSEIMVKFPDTTAMLASNISLECFALGNPIPDIVWRKVDATDLPANHEISESGAVLHLFNVQYEDVGAYECEAINTKGKDWHKAWLYVESAPEWAETINNTQIDIGSEHTMRCMASGKPFPYIRWYKDGYMYGKGELKFSSLTFDDSGMYQCIAENFWGIKYANAELRVVAYGPTFELNPVKRQLLGAQDNRVVIECKPRAAPRPRFTWKKGKELLFNNSRIAIMSDGTLEILNATKNDEGVYTCFAENDRGKANSSGTLTITEATSLTVVPEDTYAKVGEEVILSCSASHDPMLDVVFIWAIDHRVIDFDTEWQHYERIMDGDSGDLRINNVQVWHEGRYTCTAQTVVDNATADTDLKVVGVPGPPGIIRVEDIGDKWVKLLWSKGADHNSPILYYTIQTRHFWALHEDDWRDALTSPAFLDGNVEMADVIDLYPWLDYQFRIIAHNQYGPGEASIPSLKIKTWDAAPMVAPTDVAGYGGGVARAGEIVITWTPVQPWHFSGKKFGYVVAFKPADAYDWGYKTVSDPETRRYVVSSKDFQITESDFQVREFHVKVKSFNIKGDGPYSLTKTIYYPREVPTESPTDVYARPVSSHEALVWWLPVVDTGTGLHQFVEGYQVKYWVKYDDTEPGANRIFVPATANQTRLEFMRPDAHYLIEVRAYNGAGFGPPSEHCEMFTRRAPPPEAPRVWRWISWTGMWLYVWWDHLHYDWFGNISFPLYYKVMFRKTGYYYGKVYVTGWHFMDFPMPQLGDYELMVRGRYEGGDGPVRMIKLLGKASMTTPSLGMASLLLLALCIVGLEI